MKSLKDISWDVSEETYRTDPALSYSTLARYEREGFNNLDKLFDRIETPSLTFGSAVDSIITGGWDEFNERFINLSFPNIPDAIVNIVKALFNEFHETHRTLDDIPDAEIIGFASQFNYQNNWKPETKVKTIREKGNEYYSLLYAAGDKTILEDETYQAVINAVNALKESDSTSFYFTENNPFDDIERYYQLKFKACLEGIDYRCMADLIIVDHEHLTVQPCDLKTSSHTEWDFYKSFIDWRYDIQARLYWQIIYNNMMKDDTFKYYKLLPYKFIVVNKRTLTPLVWDCPFTQSIVELKVGRFEQYKLRHPFEIGKELHAYLSSRPQVPNGINLTTSNNLNEWLKLL